MQFSFFFFYLYCLPLQCTLSRIMYLLEAKMDAPTLQAVLEKKYDIKEKLYAEGKFVGLLRKSRNAVNLVGLGIGQTCFVVALVVLSEDNIDYDLLSLTPLSVLAFSCHSISKRIKVRSEFKATQVYQLCSSARQAEIWDNFLSVIKEHCTVNSSNVWFTPELVSCSSVDSMATSMSKSSTDLPGSLKQHKQLESSSQTAWLPFPEGDGKHATDLFEMKTSQTNVHLHFEDYYRQVEGGCSYLNTHNGRSSWAVFLSDRNLNGLNQRPLFRSTSDFCINIGDSTDFNDSVARYWQSIFVHYLNTRSPSLPDIPLPVHEDYIGNSQFLRSQSTSFVSAKIQNSAINATSRCSKRTETVVSSQLSNGPAYVLETRPRKPTDVTASDENDIHTVEAKHKKKRGVFRRIVKFFSSCVRCKKDNWWKKWQNIVYCHTTNFIKISWNVDCMYTTIY